MNEGSASAAAEDAEVLDYPYDPKMRVAFEEGLAHLLQTNKSLRSVVCTDAKYQQILEEVKNAKMAKRDGFKLTGLQYRRLNRYDWISVGGNESLIAKKDKIHGSTKFFCRQSRFFNVIHKAHIDSGHRKLRATELELRQNYANVTRKVISIYLDLCNPCPITKGWNKGTVKKPITPEIAALLENRCRVTIIDMQHDPDRTYKFILQYQYVPTNFVVLRPLETQTSNEIASQLVDIFCLIGTPYLLETSHKGPKIMKSLIETWPDVKLALANPKACDQRSLVLEYIQKENLTDRAHWSAALKFIQNKINRSINTETGSTPFKNMFGNGGRNGLTDLNLPQGNITSEEELVIAFKSSKNKKNKLKSMKKMNYSEEEDSEEVIYLLENEREQADSCRYQRTQVEGETSEESRSFCDDDIKVEDETSEDSRSFRKGDIKVEDDTSDDSFNGRYKKVDRRMQADPGISLIDQISESSRLFSNEDIKVEEDSCLFDDKYIKVDHTMQEDVILLESDKHAKKVDNGISSGLEIQVEEEISMESSGNQILQEDDALFSETTVPDKQVIKVEEEILSESSEEERNRSVDDSFERNQGSKRLFGLVDDAAISTKSRKMR